MRVQAAAAAGFPFMQAPRNGWSVILSLSVKTVQAWLFLLRQVESAGEESMRIYRYLLTCLDVEEALATKHRWRLDAAHLKRLAKCLERQLMLTFDCRLQLISGLRRREH